MNFKIPLPPFEIQEQIVEEIENYQKIIDGAKQIIENYKPTIKIQSDWEMVELGEVCKFIDYRGKTPLKTDSGIRLITAKNIKQGEINIDPQEFISHDTFMKWSTRGEVLKYDVFITTEAPLGAVAMNMFDEVISIAQRIISLRAKDDTTLSQQYLLNVLLSTHVQDKIQGRRSGTTVYGIKSSELVKIEIPLPPFDIQQKIVAQIESEQKAVAECKRLVEIFEQKMQDKINEVWGFRVPKTTDNQVTSERENVVPYAARNASNDFIKKALGKE